MPAKVKGKEQLLEKCGLKNDSVLRKLLSEYAVEKVTLRTVMAEISLTFGHWVGKMM